MIDTVTFKEQHSSLNRRISLSFLNNPVNPFASLTSLFGENTDRSHIINSIRGWSVKQIYRTQLKSGKRDCSCDLGAVCGHWYWIHPSADRLSEQSGCFIAVSVRQLTSSKKDDFSVNISRCLQMFFNETVHNQ